MCPGSSHGACGLFVRFVLSTYLSRCRTYQYSGIDVKVVVLNWCNYQGLGEWYVDRLRYMLASHLRLPYEFTVVTENDLPPGRAGWFNKLTLLEMFDGEVLYLDLDIDIRHNIDELIELGRTDPEKIWARNDFSYPVSSDAKVQGNGYAGPLMHNGREATINSSVMYWNGKKDMSGAEALIASTHGDQGIITRLFWPDGIRLFPDHLIKSYRYHVLQGLGVGSITLYHGSPKPHDLAW